MVTYLIKLKGGAPCKTQKRSGADRTMMNIEMREKIAKAVASRISEELKTKVHIVFPVNR